MIRKATEVNVRKRFRVLIYGVPGIAKSTTALSAPAPLMVDTDKGWDRIPALHRKGDYIQPESYEEILEDLKPENVKPYETIIFDTGGALLNLMKLWAIRQNSQNGQKDGITLSQRGYGVIGQEFQRLFDYVYYQLGKHVVITFHAKEDIDSDIKCYRLDVEGQTRNNVWKPMDLGGFMEAVRDKRVIGFSPTDRYFAKGTHGIEGVYEIPNVMKPGVPNDFLTNLFIKINNNIAEEIRLVEDYRKLMAEWKGKIEAIQELNQANEAIEGLKKVEHILTSKTELWHALKGKAEACGWKYDPVAGIFYVDRKGGKR